MTACPATVLEFFLSDAEDTIALLYPAIMIFNTCPAFFIRTFSLQIQTWCNLKMNILAVCEPQRQMFLVFKIREVKVCLIDELFFCVC